MNDQTIHERGLLAKAAGITLSATDLALRHAGLSAIAAALDRNREQIIAANRLDCTRAEAEGLDAPLLKRLTFDDHKIDEVITGIHDLITLPDPLGQTQLARELDNGLELFQVTCPIGVLGVIFESRPDAFVQISALALKSGNAVLMKGGHEALETNRILYTLIAEQTAAVGLPSHWIANLESRDEVNALLALDDCVDLIIPRGSNAFVRYIMDHSRIPVMGHADGICHVYVDRACHLDDAIAIAVDAKAQYVAVCNAAETLLVHKDIADTFLPRLQKAMTDAGVTLRGDAQTCGIIDTAAASDADWSTEYLDYILSVKVVDSLDAAIDHINHYGSGHTDVIVTTNNDAAKRFTDLVDSACVFVNCSSRFSDGFRFGFGAEVGITTGKLHARGPVGLSGLVSIKYKLIGHGHIVAPYAQGSKKFTHRNLEKNCTL